MQPELPGVKYLSEEEGYDLFERQVQKYLGMSGEEFVKRYRNKDVDDLPHSDVIRIVMLLPFARDYGS